MKLSNPIRTEWTGHAWRAATLLGIGSWVQMALAMPPGAPMGDFGPNQLAVSAFFDHNGLSLYEDPAMAVMNTAGLGIEYAPLRFVQIGAFAGGTEVDVAVPDSRQSDTAARAFNGDYSFAGGGELKLATPHFVGDAMRFVAYGNATWFRAEDASGNLRSGFYYQGGLTLQWTVMPRLNLVLGAEYHALDGTQENTLKKQSGFGLNAAEEVDAGRGLIGVEYTFPQKNRPFISVSFRPNGNLGWDDRLGIKNASVAVSFGVITDLGRVAPGKQEEEVNSPMED